MNNFEREKELRKKGYKKIAGVDEVGRGCIAGPVVACAIVMKPRSYIEGVTDSKLISDKRRRELKEEILKKALDVRLAFIEEDVIDEVNIYQATKLAMTNAIKALDVEPDLVITDAMKLDIDIPVNDYIKGDMLYYSISCASIVAKVARDDYMIALSKQYPEYDLASNKGYPTKKHKQALLNNGILPIHRKTYAPVAEIINKSL